MSEPNIESKKDWLLAGGAPSMSDAAPAASNTDKSARNTGLARGAEVETLSVEELKRIQKRCSGFMRHDVALCEANYRLLVGEANGRLGMSQMKSLYGIDDDSGNEVILDRLFETCGGDESSGLSCYEYVMMVHTCLHGSTRERYRQHSHYATHIKYPELAWMPDASVSLATNYSHRMIAPLQSLPDAKNSLRRTKTVYLSLYS